MRIELITLSLPVVPPLGSFPATLQTELQIRDPDCELLRWAIVRVEQADPHPIAQIEAVITRDAKNWKDAKNWTER